MERSHLDSYGDVMEFQVWNIKRFASLPFQLIQLINMKLRTLFISRLWKLFLEGRGNTIAHNNFDLHQLIWDQVNMSILNIWGEKWPQRLEAHYLLERRSTHGCFRPWPDKPVLALPPYRSLYTKQRETLRPPAWQPSPRASSGAPVCS